MPCIRVTAGTAHEPAPSADGSIFAASAHFLALNTPCSGRRLRRTSARTAQNYSLHRLILKGHKAQPQPPPRVRGQAVFLSFRARFNAARSLLSRMQSSQPLCHSFCLHISYPYLFPSKAEAAVPVPSLAEQGDTASTTRVPAAGPGSSCSSGSDDSPSAAGGWCIPDMQPSHGIASPLPPPPSCSHTKGTGCCRAALPR